MQKWLHQLIHRLFYIVAIVILIWAVLAGSLRLIVTPWLVKHTPRIQQIIQQKTGYNVKFSSITVSWFFLTPELILKDVTIKQLQMKQNITLRKFKIAVNPFTYLFNHHLLPSQVEISGLHLNIVQDKKGLWHIPALNITLNDDTHIDIKPWETLINQILSTTDFKFSHVRLIIQHPEFPTQAFRIRFIELINKGQQHSLKMKLRKEKNDNIAIKASLNGNLIHQGQLNTKKISAIVNLNADDFYIDGQGVEEGQLRLTWNGRRGTLELNTYNPAFHFGHLFRANLPLKELTIQAVLKQETDGLHIKIEEGVALIPEGRATFKGYWHQPALTAIPRVDLTADVHAENVKSASPYLPTAIMPKELIHWLDTAIKGANVVDGRLTLLGNLKDFPFNNEEGLFLINGYVQGGQLAYWPGWPEATDLNANLLFRNNGMFIIANAGKLNQIPFEQVTAHLPMMGSDDAVEWLTISGKASASILQGVNFLQKSPLNNALGKPLANLKPTGDAALDLTLRIPLTTDVKQHMQYKGQVQIKNATVNLADHKLPITQINGLANFDEKQFSTQRLAGKLFSRLININVSSKAQGDSFAAPLIAASGVINFNQLYKALDYSFLSYFSGDSRYHLTLTAEQTAEALPSSIEADFNQLNVFAQTLHQVNVQINNKPSLISVFANSNELNGQLQFFMNRNKKVDKIALNFNRLHLITHEGKQTNKKIDSKVQPRDTVPIDININDLIFNNKKLGKLSFSIVPQNAINQALFQNIKLTAESYIVSATGKWQSGGGANIGATSVQGVLKINNLQNTFKRWQMPPVMNSKNANLNFNLMWPGSPQSMTLAGLNGQIDFTVKRGLIPKIDSSSAAKLAFVKLINILSLQSIANKISFNFQDMDSQGLAFDTLTGLFKLTNGNAVTENTSLQSSAIGIKLKGRMGMVAQDYDLIMTVTPYLTSSLPVVATIAGGPVAGAATWAVNKLLVEPVSSITSYIYVITGPWDKPVIKEQARRQAVQPQQRR